MSTLVRRLFAAVVFPLAESVRANNEPANLRRAKFRTAPFIAVAVLVVATAAIAGAQQIQRIPSLPATSHEYANIPLPAHFNNNNIANVDNTPGNNPITNEGATLGRVLFYDTLLSANDTVSCSSCHLQEHGFSDPDALSIGFDGELTGRNSMGLTNARYYENGHFFWDERAETLEEQVLMPIQDNVEMGLTLAEMETKLAGTDYYPALFEDAFGTTDITSDRVALALAQFVRSMVSYQSKYDVGVAQNFNNFTAQENQGRRIFEGGAGGCAACHGTDIQIADQTFNNGLDATTTDEGEGNGRFKVPSLRNIELTGPYMHDGRFATLAEVVEHYNSGVQAHPNLANQLRVRGNGGGGGGVQPERLNLSQAEKDALVAFMITLTDDVFTNDERFADPFVDAPAATATAVPTATPNPTATATAVPPTQVAPTAVPPTQVAPTAVPPTQVAPTAVPETGEQETVDVRPGRRREVRFGNTRNGPRLRLNIPGNSLSQVTSLTFIRIVSAPEVTDANVVSSNPGESRVRFAGTRFTLTALQGANVTAALNFNTPVDFEVRYPEQDDENLDDQSIRLFLYDQQSGTWVSAACGDESVDAADSVVRAEVCQTGEFALLEVTAALTDESPTAELPPTVELTGAVYLPMFSGR